MLRRVPYTAGDWNILNTFPRLNYTCSPSHILHLSTCMYKYLHLINTCKFTNFRLLISSSTNLDWLNFVYETVCLHATVYCPLSCASSEAIAHRQESPQTRTFHFYYEPTSCQAINTANLAKKQWLQTKSLWCDLDCPHDLPLSMLPQDHQCRIYL